MMTSPVLFHVHYMPTPHATIISPDIRGNGNITTHYCYSATTTTIITTTIKSAICLAHLAATLIGDDSHSSEELRRRSAGGKVLMNLAILAKPQPPKEQQQGQQQEQPFFLEDTVDPSSLSTEGAGAAEALRYVIQLAESVGLTERASTSAGSSSASASGMESKADVAVHDPAGRVADAGIWTRASFSGLGDWVHQTLAPILSLSTSARSADHENGVKAKRCHDSGSRGTAANEALPPPPPQPLPVAAGSVGSGTPASPRAKTATTVAEAAAAARGSRDLWAALAVANALVQAARQPAAPATSGASDGLRSRSLLPTFLLETSLASGLLALTRGPLFHLGTLHQSESGNDDPNIARPNSAATAAATTTSASSDRVAYSGSVNVGGCASMGALSSAAMAIVKDAAGLCPEGMWTGLRVEVLPALAGSPCFFGKSDDVVGDVVDATSDVRETDGGARGWGRGHGHELRWGARVLREAVDGMGTGVVPFASRLLPVALRGMTHADEEVRDFQPQRVVPPCLFACLVLSVAVIQECPGWVL